MRKQKAEFIAVTAQKLIVKMCERGDVTDTIRAINIATRLAEDLEKAGQAPWLSPS